MLLKTENMIFVFEFKINSSAQVAIEQILVRGYHDQFDLDSRQVILVGANFDEISRSINEWCIKEV